MLQMSAETEAWWRAVPGYARSFCEKVPGLDPPPFSTQPAKHGLTVEPQMRIFRVRWAVFIF